MSDTKVGDIVLRGEARLILEARSKGWFNSGGDVFIARAPARLDIMGGIADYSGSHVLEMPLKRAVFVGCGRRNDDKLRVLSFEAEKEGFKPQVEMRLSDLFDRSGSPKSYEELRKLFSGDPLAKWAGYVLGAFHVLIREGIVKGFPCGADIAVRSDVPMGVGIASSAALEVASMFAIAVCFGIDLEPIRIAKLCQIVENRIVGAPCGIMDQITSALGGKDKLIPILCQPDKLLEPIEIPGFIRFVGINSKTKRSTAGDAYTETRTAAFMGLTIITQRFNPPINGYLCNITPQEFRSRFAPALPLRMKGEEFLRIYGDTVDTVTKVDPRKTYRVRSCAEHPIYENHRVKRFIKIMRGLSRFDTAKEAKTELIKAGCLMYASHWSYKYRAGLGSKEVDLIVKKARELGVERGIYGAKITGGGGGGTVALLCEVNTDDPLYEICRYYRKQTGFDPELFVGSSGGAMTFGVRRIKV